MFDTTTKGERKLFLGMRLGLATSEKWKVSLSKTIKT